MQANPVEYFRIFFRRKWFIIVPTFIGLVLGICSGIIMPKKYRSFTTIQIQENKSDNPLFENLAVASSMEQRVKAVREKMLSWTSLVELVKRLNLDADFKTPSDLEEFINEHLREEIEFEFRDSNIIEVSYVGENPLETQAIVQNVTQIFIEGNVTVQTKETADAILFIQEQLNVYRGKIKSSEIAQLKDRLRELLIDSTEMHPQVKLLREQINLKMEELRKENLVYSEEARLSAESTNLMLDEIRKALNVVGRKSPEASEANSSGEGIYKAMLIDKMDNVMARDVDVNTAIYNSLLQRLETAKITQRLQASKEGTKYSIVNPPLVPLKPVQPNIPMNILAGLFMGLAIGGGIVLIMEFLDKSFLDVQEAKEFFGAPLLGAISKIITTEIIEQKRQQQNWFLFWMASAGILLIAFTIMFAAVTKG